MTVLFVCADAGFFVNSMDVEEEIRNAKGAIEANINDIASVATEIQNAKGALEGNINEVDALTDQVASLQAELAALKYLLRDILPTTTAPETTAALYEAQSIECDGTDYCTIQDVATCEEAAAYLGASDTSARTMTDTAQVAGCSTSGPGKLRFNDELSSTAIHGTNGLKAVFCAQCTASRVRGLRG